MTHNHNYHHFDETKSWSVLKFNSELASSIENQVHKLVDFAEGCYECSPSKETIDILKQVGVKVAIKHERVFHTELSNVILGNTTIREKDYYQIQQKGGRTIVTLTDATGCSVTGVAYCNKSDSYNKKLGVAIALRRALRTVL